MRRRESSDGENARRRAETKADTPRGYQASALQEKSTPTTARGGSMALSAAPQRSFERRTASSTAAAPATTRPAPREARGRWFFALILLAVCAWITFEVWTAFLAYEAFGVVEGHRLEVSTTTPGSVKELHVTEGQRVSRGDVIAELDNLALRQELAEAQDAAALALADVATKRGDMTWQRAWRADQYYEATAEHRQLEARLEAERARLTTMLIEHDDLRELLTKRAANPQELTLKEVAIAGQRQQITRLEQAAKELETRVEASAALVSPNDEALEAHRVRTLAAERAVERVRQKLAAMTIRSPVNGVVLEVLRRPGESVDAGDPVAVVLDERTVRAVLYVPQDDMGELPVDGTLRLWTTVNEPTEWRIERRGTQMLPAPDPIKLKYHQHQTLLPVYLKPATAAAPPAYNLTPGQVVRWPKDVWSGAWWADLFHFGDRRETRGRDHADTPGSTAASASTTTEPPTAAPASAAGGDDVESR